jgi:hypothetical protein
VELLLVLLVLLVLLGAAPSTGATMALHANDLINIFSFTWCDMMRMHKGGENTHKYS